MLELAPAELLDDEWAPIGPVSLPSGAEFEPKRAIEPRDEIKDQLRAVRIEIADYANTTVISSDKTTHYLRTELGMNIVVPKGKIRELRFQVHLIGDQEGVYAIDGFPNDKVEEHALVSGTVTVGVTKAFKLLLVGVGSLAGGPIGAAAGAAAGGAADLLKVDLNREFSIGDVRDVQIDFSGPNTANVEWWFKGGSGVMNSLGVMLTVKTPRRVSEVHADVRALWDYDAGFWRSKLGSETKTVALFPSN